MNKSSEILNIVFNTACSYFETFCGFKKRIKVLVFCAVSILAMLSSFLFSGATFAFRVEYHGKTIATVKDKATYNAAVVEVTRSISGSDVSQFVDEPVFTSVIVLGNDIDNTETVVKAIIDNTDTIVEGTALKVNGETVACVSGEDLAGRVEEMRVRFEPENVPCASEFVDMVEVEDGYYLSNEILTLDYVTSIIENLQVKTIVNNVEDRAIPYTTITRNNSSMSRGNSRVITAGQDGVSRVSETITYINGVENSRVQTEAITVSAPVTRVVEVGTAKSVASSYDKQIAYNSGFQFPLPKGVWVVSAYYGDGRNHQAIDLACKAGTNIYAVRGGTVVSAGWDGTYGYSIVIDHGNRIKTRYAHAKALYVSAGEVVESSQVIATVGKTGKATGNHLHFEVILNGNRVDPAPYIGLD